MLKQIFRMVRLTANVALLVTSPAAIAQAWSFDQIAQQALATHPAVLSRQASSAAAQAELNGASWQRFPTPSLELGGDNNGVATTLFRLQQPLWTGGRITAGIDAANSRHEAAEMAIGETKQELLFRIIAGYVEATRQQERAATVAKGVEQHEQLLGMITRRVQQEASPQVDQGLAQSRLYQAANDLSQVKQALATALTQLSVLAGQPIASVIPLDSNDATGAGSKSGAIDQAIGASLTLERLTFDEAAAQADVDLKKASILPQLSVRYENARASAPLNGIPGYSTSRVLLVVESQTGAGLSALSGIEAAAARRDAIRLQRETARRDIEERVAIDWDEWMAARNRLDNSRFASTSAREVAESYTRQFTAGRKTWLDVLNTIRESTQSDVAVIDAHAQVAAALLRLRLETGNLMGLKR
ncbi:MAG: hypothetical protein JWN94_3869 [Betaproteobacteria bacterium]|nr:hypothetical protein [Betaproteobacteria bacterium]